MPLYGKPVVYLESGCFYIGVSGIAVITFSSNSTLLSVGSDHTLESFVYIAGCRVMSRNCVLIIIRLPAN